MTTSEKLEIATLSITFVTLVITGLGVWFALKQLRENSRQNVTGFEDELAQEYRQLASTFPTKALLGEALNLKEQNECLDEFYHYFDLCNGQAFLRQNERVSAETWKFWSDGIKTNMKRPAFAAAWIEISTRAPEDFNELRQLIREEFKTDPVKWKKEQPGHPSFLQQHG